MIVSPLSLEGSYVIDPERRRDERGYFARVWCEKELPSLGLGARIAQVNIAVSPRAGTLRGLHFQRHPHGETKIVRCTRGAVFDVIVDLRPNSSTFRQWTGLELSSENGRMIYAPEGTAHGFLTLSDDSEVLYFTSRAYAPEAATGIRYNDPAFDIKWPRSIEIVSEADEKWPDLS
jgi:dTDP-4-dehydrorhamnose 3,5-epimerase